MKRPFPWTWALLALLPLVPLWRCVFLGEVIGPWDQVSNFWPFQPQPLRGAWDVLQADSALQFFGWRDLVFHAWANGQMPLWNPYQLAGSPLLANSQSAGFYPLHILMGVLHVPTGPAITLLAWIHLALAGFGVRALAMRFGSGEAGATVGGALFMLSAFVLGWLPLASVVTTVAWIPWVLWAGLGLFEKPTPVRAAGLAALVAMMCLAGHLQFVFYGLLGLAVLVAGRLVTAARAKEATLATMAYGVLGVALGLGLAGAQLLPVFQLSKLSHRHVTPDATGYQSYIAGAPKPFELAGAVYPGALGFPGRAEEGVEGEPYPQHWPASTRIGASFAESAFCIGPAALALLAGLRRRRSWFLAGPVVAVGAFGLLAALGTPLDAALYFGVPGWASTGSPGRASVLFVLAACAVAALGWPEEGEECPRRTVLAVSLAGALLTILILVSAKSLTTWANPAATVEWQVSRRMLDVLPSAGLALALVAAYIWFQKSKLVPVAIACLLGAQLATQVTTVVPSGTFPSVKSGVSFDPATRYAFENDAWPLLTRAKHALLPPDLASALRVQDIAGYDSLLPEASAKMMSDIDGKDAAPEANGNIQFVKPGADRTALADAGVSVLVHGPDATAEQIRSSGIVETDYGDAETPVLRADGFDLRVHGPSEVTVRFLRLPGWTLDGDPPGHLDPHGTWLTYRDPSRSDAVLRFRYVPPGLATGFGLTGLSLAVVLALLILAHRRPPGQSAKSEPALAV